jgi:hypothetical protein
MRPVTAFITLLFALLLGGCASLTPSECATADWYGLGREDGTSGRHERIAQHHEACAKVHIAVDANAYRLGRAAGLQQYCRLDHAISEGLAGASYGGVCPGPKDLAFRQHHEAGMAVYTLRHNLGQFKAEQDRLDKELRDPKASDDRRRELRALLAQLDRKLEHGREELNRAQYRLDRLLAELRASGAY